jgi:cytochrome c553
MVYNSGSLSPQYRTKMTKKLIISALFVFGVSMLQAASGGNGHSEAKAPVRGDAIAGSSLVAVCAGCHGADGNSLVGQWPTLAGQRESYLYEQLEHIQKGERMIPSMMGILDPYDEEDLRNISAFYAAQTTKVGQADKTNIALGEKIYRAGNKESAVPACAACHGPNGRGLELAQYPMLGGQKAEYVVTSLIAYQNGQRGEDSHALIMQGIASRLTNEEIRAVANYVSGLY